MSRDNNCTCEASRHLDAWVVVLYASCRMLAEQPAAAAAIRVGLTLPDASDNERSRAMALARCVAEEYCASGSGYRARRIPRYPSDDDARPDPDALLRAIQHEKDRGRGELRIYLGAAPGVGKTYAMLHEGKRRLARGTDGLMAFAETYASTHGGSPQRPRSRPPLAGRVPRRRAGGDGHGCGDRAPSSGGARRRTRTYQRTRFAAREAVGGC